MSRRSIKVPAQIFERANQICTVDAGDDGTDLLLHFGLFAESRILVQHAHKPTRESLRSLFESWGCLVFSAANHAEALRLAGEYPIQVALISAEPHDHEEFLIMKQFHKKNNRLQILLLGDQQGCKKYEDALALGAAGVVIRPVRAPELKSLVMQILRAQDVEHVSSAL